MSMELSPDRLVPVFQAALETRGFVAANDPCRYRLNGLTAELDVSWLAMRSSARLPGADPLQGMLGAPGFWKADVLPDGNCGRVFHLPLAALTSAGCMESEEELAASCVAWAIDTAAGRLPTGWQAPARSEVEACLSGAALTAQRFGQVRQGTLHVMPKRLAVSFPLLARWPAELPAARAAWLRELLVNAQSQWRLVRVGVAADGAVCAEVDLTGAPAGILEGLVGRAVGCARLFVESLMESAELLATASVACHAVEVCKPRARTRRKE